MRCLFFLCIDNKVYGIIEGVWPSPLSEIVKHGNPSFGFAPVKKPIIFITYDTLLPFFKS